MTSWHSNIAPVQSINFRGSQKVIDREPQKDYRTGIPAGCERSFYSRLMLIAQLAQSEQTHSNCIPANSHQ